MFNINKAYHMDDTFHLEAASWIKEHPFRPMSGFINWDENKEPMHKANQPPLYFYLVALVSSLFGTGEIALHLFQSIFALLSLVIFYRITQSLALKKGLLLTALLAFCPAFLINQNLMVDSALLCCELGAFYYLLTPNESSPSGPYWKASLLLTLSLLIKYTTMPLLVVLLITILWRKQYRYLYIVLVPIAALGLWSVWNYVEYASIHIVNRPKNPMTLFLVSANVLNFIICLGSISPFSLAFLTGYLSRHRFTVYLIPIVALSFVGLTIATAQDQVFIGTANTILSTTFLINGLLLLLFVGLSVWKNSLELRKSIKTTDVILVLWIASISGFIILFAPFIASRHVLLIIPPILLLGGRWIETLSVVNTWQSVVVAATLTSILAINDWMLADFYRQKAREAAIVLPHQRRIWTAGHWGWQWYAHQHGFKEIQADSMQFRAGDYLVKPQGIDSQQVPEGVTLQQIGYLTSPYNWLLFVSTGLYSCFYGRGTAWAYSKFPIDTVKMYRITAVPAEPRQLYRVASMRK
ncbi:hypothetical protein GCM10028809_04300 [Spirosoma gilvum]